MEMSINWAQPDERDIDRNDACWYIYGSTSDLVCSISNGVKTVNVYADGEMRVHVIDEAGEVISVIRYCDQFAQWGIISDTDIGNHVFGDDPHTAPNGQKVTFDVVNSPWFDLYDDEGYHLDYVRDTLTGAVTEATNLLKTADYLTY